MSMITVSEAHDRLRRNSRVRVDNESVDLNDCLGRVLAADVVSSIDVPPADNSAMDGYALRREDLSLIHISEPTRLLVQSRMPSSA